MRLTVSSPTRAVGASESPEPLAGQSLGAAPGSATLELTLKRKWFDMVASGEKKEEYRQPSDWILSRLHGKRYSRVRFRNGYSTKSPVVICEYLGWETGHGKLEWGAGFDVVIIIKLGRVIESPNSKLRDGAPETPPLK